MTKSRAFAQVDVFSSTPYLGNPVAVILDGDGLSEEEMLRVAKWTNLSETTFLLTPTDSDADYRVRIFTPGGELPFAGHPTLGSAHAWVENGGVPQRPDVIVQECQAGLVSLRRDEGALSFQAPPTVRSGPIEAGYLADITTSFSLSVDDVVAHQWVDNGPGWCVIQLATAEEVLKLEPDLSSLPDAMVGVIGAYPASSADTFEVRAFAPRIGVPEDPVCGSINASIGQWLIGEGLFTSGYQVSQGQRLGRAGTIRIMPDEDGRVWVGGRTMTLFRGTAVI
ncbi:PhzF family phenazine biosynthesis protein [Frondihabitans cladoniiphilus]|uniref:PhzF family phenazine biosynthesis protein n=1 Tax=Frondihabitans cladoniiphilus TaxID=715785 RepID=A0ABP8W6M3_9MICO